MSIKRFLLALLLLPVLPYAQVDSQSSNLPIMRIETDGQAIPDEPKITATTGSVFLNSPCLRRIIDFRCPQPPDGLYFRLHSPEWQPHLPLPGAAVASRALLHVPDRRETGIQWKICGTTALITNFYFCGPEKYHRTFSRR